MNVATAFLNFDKRLYDSRKCFSRKGRFKSALDFWVLNLEENSDFDCCRQSFLIYVSFCAKQVLCFSLRRDYVHKAGINLFEVKDGKKSMIPKNFENHRICKNKWDIFGSSLCFSSQIERCRTLEAHRWETNNLTTKLTPWILKEQEQVDSGNWKV